MDTLALILSIIGCLNWGLVGLWVGIFSDQACRFIFGFLRFRTGKWTQLKL